MTLSLSTIKALTYYISPTGNDNAAGTSPSTAWQSISKLNSINLLPGTIVLFEGGKTFQGSINLDASDANNATNPIVISSYGTGKALVQSGATMGFYSFNTKGFEVSNLIFEGSGMSTNTTDGVKIYTNLGGDVKLENIKITNVEIRNYGVVGLYIYSSNYNTGFKNLLVDQVHIHHVRENGLFVKGYTAPTWVGWGHQNITIRSTEVNDVPGYADANTHRGSGIIMAQVDGGVIENCAAYHNGTGNTHCGGPGGIWAYDCNNITIQHCESYNNSSGSGCDGLGFDLDGGITNSVMQYNYSHNNDGAGYLLGQYDGARTWSNNVVRYNISENDGRTNSSGITLFKGPNSTMNGCKIYNNTVYTSPSSANSGVGAFAITEWNTGIEGTEVYNNIFQTTGGAYLINIPTGYEAAVAGNLYWPTGGTFKIRYHGTNYSSLSAWQTAANGYEKVGSLLTGITADPLLTNAGGGAIVWPSPTASLNAYKISASSPAINTALNLNSLFAINTGTLDFFNSALPANNLRDIGAYERPTIIVTALPITHPIKIKVSIYPNPVSPGESLHFSGTEGPCLFELYSINGSLILKQMIEGEQELRLPEGITNGIYVLRLSDSKGEFSNEKIIVR
ncbi:MAG: T9SS type A sorting domain-containing protein [Bacteroidia bacterium]